MDASILSASSDLLIEQLLSAKFAEREISIGLSKQYGITTADLTWDEYNSDQMLSLRYHADEHFDLYYSYYEEEDVQDFLTFIHPLSSEQTAALPVGLGPVMSKALADQKPLVVIKNLITQPDQC